MPLQKCPRCELNYILDDATVCTVCYREMKGDPQRDTLLEFCSACNENPSLPGKDLCLFCQKELEKAAKTAEEGEENYESPIELDASEMQEIEMDTQDIPNSELGVIDRELSLDDILAEEESDDDDPETDE